MAAVMIMSLAAGPTMRTTKCPARRSLDARKALAPETCSTATGALLTSQLNRDRDLPVAFETVLAS